MGVFFDNIVNQLVLKGEFSVHLLPSNILVSEKEAGLVQVFHWRLNCIAFTII